MPSLCARIAARPLFDIRKRLVGSRIGRRNRKRAGALDLVAAEVVQPLESRVLLSAVVNVATDAQLQNAVANLSSGTTVLLAPGTYNLSSTLVVRDVTDVAIRGASGKAGDVVLVGRGMSNPSFGGVPHGISFFNSQRVTVADLTIRDVYYHSIILNPGCEQPVISNVRLINAGEQFIKASPVGFGNGVDHGIVENSVFEHTTTARSDYTNGVDVHGGAGWTIRGNTFRNIRSPQGAGSAGPAILMWRGSRDTLVEANRFFNCERAIALGLDSTPGDHSGGIVRNNTVHRAAGQSGDVAIYVTSANAKILHNTVVLSGTYPNAIEYRFAGATGVEVRHNLTDSQIVARDGAKGVRTGNVTTALPSWFVNAAAGDLHLTATAVLAIDKVSVLVDAQVDLDGQARPAGVSATDVGADEYVIALAAPQVIDVRFGYGNGLWVSTRDLTGRTAPWKIARIQFVFDADVVVEAADLVVRGMSGTPLALSDFDYDPAARTATWTLATAVERDRLSLALDGDDASSDGKDGTRAAAAPVYLRSGDYTAVLEVLMGDVNGDGRIDLLDALVQRSRNGTSDRWADIDGSGEIDLLDALLVRSKNGTTLP